MFRWSCVEELADLNTLQQRCRPLLRATLTVCFDALHDDGVVFMAVVMCFNGSDLWRDVKCYYEHDEVTKYACMCMYERNVSDSICTTYIQ